MVESVDSEYATREQKELDDEFAALTFDSVLQQEKNGLGMGRAAPVREKTPEHKQQEAMMALMGAGF